MSAGMDAHYDAHDQALVHEAGELVGDLANRHTLAASGVAMDYVSQARGALHALEHLIAWWIGVDAADLAPANLAAWKQGDCAQIEQIPRTQNPYGNDDERREYWDLGWRGMPLPTN